MTNDLMLNIVVKIGINFSDSVKHKKIINLLQEIEKLATVEDLIAVEDLDGVYRLKRGDDIE